MSEAQHVSRLQSKQGIECECKKDRFIMHLYEAQTSARMHFGKSSLIEKHLIAL